MLIEYINYSKCTIILEILSIKGDISIYKLFFDFRLEVVGQLGHIGYF